MWSAEEDHAESNASEEHGKHGADNVNEGEGDLEAPTRQGVAAGLEPRREFCLLYKAVLNVGPEWSAGLLSASCTSRIPVDALTHVHNAVPARVDGDRLAAVDTGSEAEKKGLGLVHRRRVFAYFGAGIAG